MKTKERKTLRINSYINDSMIKTWHMIVVCVVFCFAKILQPQIFFSFTNLGRRSKTKRENTGTPEREIKKEAWYKGQFVLVGFYIKLLILNLNFSLITLMPLFISSH